MELLELSLKDEKTKNYGLIQTQCTTLSSIANIERESAIGDETASKRILELKEAHSIECKELEKNYKSNVKRLT